jgi:hypothetical protein
MVPRRGPKRKVDKNTPRSPKVKGMGLKGRGNAKGPKMQVMAVVSATNVNSFGFSLEFPIFVSCYNIVDSFTGT